MAQAVRKTSKKTSTKTNSKKKPVARLSSPSNTNSRIKKPINPDKMEVVDQMVYIFSKSGSGKKASRKHLAAAILGFVIGGIIPIAAYVIAHIELRSVTFSDMFKMIATYKLIGCLLYSSPTVYSWAKAAFGSDTFIGKLKPFGFVLALEGVMITQSSNWIVTTLSLSALGILVFINAIASGCRLALKRTA